MIAKPALFVIAAVGGIAAVGLAWAQGAPAPAKLAPQPSAPVSVVAPPIASGSYPFYMPMQGLRRPAARLFVRCEASRRAGQEVYAAPGKDPLGGRAEGGFEIVFEATDAAGRPCVYPFSPWMPQIVGSLQGTQFILRSSVPGRRVTFRTNDAWANINLRLFDFGRQRVHFEMSDIEFDFPGSIQPKGVVNIEGFGGVAPGLFSIVIRRSKIFGGKNALFVPSGQTMLYVEDSEFAGNVGTNVDQEHTSYINGVLVSHLRNSVWYGQRAAGNQASGHQLKDKAYLRIYEDVSVTNTPNGGPPSAMPLLDLSAFGFTWTNNLRMKRLQPEQTVRDTMVDLRTEILYGDPKIYPWNVLAGGNWRMPAAPLAALDQVYLSVFHNTVADSFRIEPYVFSLRPQGLGYVPGTNTVAANDRSTPSQQRMVSLAFGTRGRFARVYSHEGWTYADPQLPAGAEWVHDRDAFIRHALKLTGR
ncbi:MAG: hypothetical protein J0M19_03070 [Sphingomonadales bacterium]|nr:hypothetical protein [Sphingomonadales bacterium]